MRLSVFEVEDQQAALKQLAELTQRSILHPTVREAAIQMVRGCDARDDACELEAIFNAVKHGTPYVKGLAKGLKYVADPRWADHFTAPYRVLDQCARGACAEDCDGHAALIAALAGSLGFKVGLRVQGFEPSKPNHGSDGNDDVDVPFLASSTFFPSAQLRPVLPSEDRPELGLDYRRFLRTQTFMQERNLPLPREHFFAHFLNRFRAETAFLERDTVFLLFFRRYDPNGES